MMKLQGARVLVVGGGSGIGFAVASACRDEGANVTIASTNPEKLSSAAERLGGVETAMLDLTDEQAVARYFAASGQFDHIASTAGDWGKARRGPFAEMDMNQAKALFGVRFWGSALLAKHGAARVNKGGSITLTAGTSAYKPQKGSVMATAMAGSVEHLTWGLAVEFAPDVRVNAVFPGGVATEIFKGLPDAMRKAEETRFTRQPIPRIGEPGEVAEAYLYLMKAGYTTGQVLIADGGGVLGG